MRLGTTYTVQQSGALAVLESLWTARGGVPMATVIGPSGQILRTAANGALNFNGFRDGELTLVVPVGWRTEIDFRNHDGMLRHSAVVIAPQKPLPTQPVDPAIARAFTLKLAAGLPSEATDAMRFAAQPAGEYLPGHGAAGMWIRLRVSATDKTPALLLTPLAGSS